MHLGILDLSNWIRATLKKVSMVFQILYFSPILKPLFTNVKLWFPDLILNQRNLWKWTRLYSTRKLFNNLLYARSCFWFHYCALWPFASLFSYYYISDLYWELETLFTSPPSSISFVALKKWSTSKKKSRFLCLRNIKESPIICVWITGWGSFCPAYVPEIRKDIL